MLMGQVCGASACKAHCVYNAPEASGFVARESVTLANLTVADQAFGWNKASYHNILD
jgi:hypothetical protein